MPNLRKFFLEDEAVEGIKSPTDYMYLKIIRFTLAFVRGWPYKEVGEYESRFWTIVFKCLYVMKCVLVGISGTYYFAINFSVLPFLEMGHIIVTMMLNIVDFSRILSLTLSDKYREVAKHFLKEFHLFFHKEKSEFAMKTHKQVHLVSHLFALYLAVLMVFGLSLFNLIPMYGNYAAGMYKPGGTQNSSFVHSLSLSFPFDTTTKMNGYIIACIVNWVLSYICGNLCCMFDLFLSVMVFHIWGHFKILNNKLNDFPKPKFISTIQLKDGSRVNAEFYSKEELLQVSKNLKECIVYHREITNFTDRMSNVFGPMLFVYYAFHQTTGCLLLLECAQMTAQALLRYLPLTVIMFQQLIQISIVFELIGTESEKLKDAVYGLPWECMDSNNRKVVKFFLMNVQEPVHVKAMGVTNVGVTSMATILKTSLSYFTFLRSI